jgi:hypothetical protein
MRLRLLSTGYISDRVCVAPVVMPAGRTRDADAGHFSALLRGVMVLVVFALTFGLTMLQETRAGEGLEADTAPVAAPR